MLIRTSVLSRAIKRRLIRRTCTVNYLNEKENDGIDNLTRFEPGTLEFSNSLIKPFLNNDKIHLLKKFYVKQNEVTCLYNFVIDENVAKDIVKHIVGHDEQSKKIIVEGNPGLGLITANLINSGVSHIYVFDDSEIWDISLAQICAKHPDRVTKVKGHLNRNSDLMLLNSLDFVKQHGLPVTIVGITTSFYFVRGLVINIGKYNLWQSKFQIFLVISNNVWSNLRDIRRKKYLKLYTHCLFKLLFNAEEIARYPQGAFLPCCKNNSEDMILVRISTNPNLFENFNQEELNDYYVFLRIIGSHRYNYIIPVLEKWLPGCGPYLISKGVAMTTMTCDLSHEEAILLFNFFKKCEGYQDFKACSSQVFSGLRNVS